MERFGIIDIGSNSIRLVVYERTAAGAHRVVDQAKESARLSERTDPEGRISKTDLQYVTDTLNRFRLLCKRYGTIRIRAVATAAVRNSPDAMKIAETLADRTGLDIEVLSGEEEARLGFLGMINAIEMNDGFAIDIGGGSTEVLLFRNRRIERSVSFPFGAVNLLHRFGFNGDLDDRGAKEIIGLVTEAAKAEPWIAGQPGLPLIGLGGTVRTLCKIDQRFRKYSLRLTHRYQLEGRDIDGWVKRLMAVPLEQRKRMDGISKDRADIIVPGLIVLDTVYRLSGAKHFIVSGTGLRDGLFFEMVRPQSPYIPDVQKYSVHNLLAMHTPVALKHLLQVERLAANLFNGLGAGGFHRFSVQEETYLRTAALLYRIGVVINYYNFTDHTYYMLAHARLDGFTHREILLCALIASFKNAKRLKPLFQKHADILLPSDWELITRLGSLLQIAVALDRSETQPVQSVNAVRAGDVLLLTITARADWDIEKREAESLSKDFGKWWGLALRIQP